MAGLDPAIQTQEANPGWPGFAALTTAMTVLFGVLKVKKPAHPGRVLKSQLEEMEIPVADAAKALGVTRQQLYRVINGDSGISPEMAVRLSKGIGSTPEIWLGMQQAYDLSQIEAGAIKVSKIGATV